MTVVEPKIISKSAPGGEHRTGRDGDPVIERQPVHLERIHRRRAFDPEKITARRRRDPISGRKMPPQRVECGRLLSGEAPAGGWKIRVTDDHRSDVDAPGQTVAISSGGLATSSTSVRQWSHGGHTMHHIIDPRTAAPARSHWRTVSVAAEDCAQANIATTAALVRSGRALDWLTRQGLPARLVDLEGRVRTIGNWPAKLSDHAAASREAAVSR